MNISSGLAFVHRFVPGTAAGAPLLLLHGTGGDENDLLPVGQALAPGRALLSPRGQVLENGMPRFFHRLAEGVFDEADVIARANELADFVIEAGKAYQLQAPIAVGFSNGANIAAAVLLLRPDVFAGAVLLRAMVPLATPPESDLGGRPVLIVSGSADPIIPITNSTTLANQLRHAKASVEHETINAGHGLTQIDLAIATQWLNRNS